MLKCGQKDNLKYTFGISQEQMEKNSQLEKELEENIFCKKCNARISKNDKFCKYCGEKYI